MRLKLGWAAQVGLVAGGLLLAALVVPVPTSLGQGISENVLVGWEGRYDHLSDQYYCRFLMQGGSVEDVRMTAFPRSWIIYRGPWEFWTTAQDLLGVLKLAYQENPHAVEEDLGTRNNVARPATPFPGSPVAYSEGLLKAMAHKRFNPCSVGGPDIPPGSVLDHRLFRKKLQIDTSTDNNTLRQCQVREMPAPLKIERSAVPD